jgi:peptide/nickel transport system substrate-binding protein
LAERYERTDLRSWKFYLRKGVKFSNGNPFTAEDVKFSFERLSDPKCCSEYLDRGKAMESIEIIDDYTLVIKTATPIPNFDQRLVVQFILDKESTGTRDPGEVSRKPIGTGAYKLVEWVEGSYVKMRANNDYWGGAPPIKEVTLRPIKESATRFAALASGEVELISGVPVELHERMVKDPKIEVISRPSRRSIFLPLGNRPGTPTADIRVRKAIYMAINEEEIIRLVMRGQAVAAAQVPTGTEVGFVKDLRRLPYDPGQARKLLKEAGYPNGFEITLAGPNDRYVQDEKIAEAVVKYLAKVGIKAKFDVKPKAAFFPEVVAGDKHNFYLIGWLDRAYDFHYAFNSIGRSFDKEKGAGAWNGTRYSDPDLDKLHEAIKQIIDVEERTRAIEKLNRMAMDEKIFVIPLHYTVNNYAARKGKGIQFSPRPDRWMVFKEISKK